MTAPVSTTPPLILDPELRATIAENAKAVDKGEKDARYVLPLLGEAGLLGRGLLDTARLIREISAEDLSAGFTVWADRVTQQYLENSGTDRALELAGELRSGGRPGVSGMAGPFKEFVGCGEIDLTAVKTDDGDGYVINGKLNWASNLYDDAVLVSGAKTADGHRLLFVVEAGHEGMGFGRPFGLLGLNATASAWVTFENVHVPAAQVLTEDFESFMAGVRPYFSLLQVSECIGVAEASAAAAGTRLHGVNATFSDDVAKATENNAGIVRRQEEIIARLDSGEKVAPTELLELRLDAAEAAVQSANLEVRVAGGAGYAKSSPASRRFREAAFIPVQSPSEAQLRWELARARENA